MAATSSSLILLLQLLSLTTACLFQQTNGDPVDQVCGQTKDPPLCSESLRLADPDGSQSTSLLDLAQLTINTAQDKAIDTKIKIHTILVQAQDPTLRLLYSNCDDLYYDALDAFRAMPGELKGQQYAALNQLGLRVRGSVNGCEAALDNNYPLKNENQVVGILADAIAVVANSLLRLN
ncbi:hypothetical protein OROMI_003172 [Orobanche minor]